MRHARRKLRILGIKRRATKLQRLSQARLCILVSPQTLQRSADGVANPRFDQRLIPQRAFVELCDRGFNRLDHSERVL